MGLNFRAIIKILGILTLIEGLFMLPAVAAGLYYEEWKAAGSLFTISDLYFCGFLSSLLNSDSIRSPSDPERDSLSLSPAGYTALCWGLFRCTYPV